MSDVGIRETTPDKEALFDYLWNRRDQVLYRAEMSTLYHRKRERFFTLLDRWDKILTLLIGSAAFVKIVNMDSHPIYALPFAVLALASLIFDFTERARRHGELAANFKMIEATIEAAGERDFSEAQLNEWSARIRQIEAGEPPAYNLLVRVCQNELARAKNQPQDVTYLSWWRVMLAHVFPFSNYKVEPTKS